MSERLQSADAESMPVKVSGLVCENISKSFDGTRALVDVSINFPETGIVAIVGPNGAGKTTLLNVLTGFLRADSGRSWMDACDISSLSPYRIAQLGIARSFQEVRLVRQISVLDNVLLARPQQRGENLLRALLRIGLVSEEVRNREIASNWLQFVRLEGKALEPAEELSYGQQKLLSLACCLATNAKILMLDEPVAGLDPEMVRIVVGILQRLRELGHSIVFIEHDLATVREVADKVVVMDEGRILAEGPPHEILNRPEIMDAFVG